MADKSINLMTRQRVRQLAGKLMEEWQNIDDVADVLGCHPSSVRRWHIEYKASDSENHGSYKEPGRPPKLTANQYNIIKDIILTKTPWEMNHPNALWSNNVIRDIIHDLFRTKLSLATVNSMTQKMGIVRRQVFRHNRNHTDEDHRDWLKNRFPLIRRLAKEQSARILLIHDDTANTTSLQFKNNTEKNDLFSGNNHTHPYDIRFLSAICPRNSQRFMTFLGPLGAHPFIEFLKGLMHDVDRHIFLIAEPNYKQIAMEADHFLSSNIERLSLFFLPESFASNIEEVQGAGT